MAASVGAASIRFRSPKVTKKRNRRERMDGSIHLNDIVPAAQNNINTTFILLEKSRVKKKKRGESRTCVALVADEETAAVHLELWGEDCDAFEEGDIIRLKKGIFSNSGEDNKMMMMVLRAGRRGSIKIGEFTMAFVETPNMSEIQWVIDPNNPRKYIHQASKQAVLSPPIPRVFPPLFSRLSADLCSPVDFCIP